MQYYFDKNGRCVITSDNPLNVNEGYICIESSEIYNPWEIRLIDGVITKQEPPKEETTEHPLKEQGDTPLPPSVESLAESVAGLYELLASVVPPTEEESEGKHE